jgi:hypothetical protein
MAYHKREIEKGVYGQFSKIREEFQELDDAHEQDARILELCELADLYGAIEGYVEVKFGFKMADVKAMSDLTKSAFREGTR